MPKISVKTCQVKHQSDSFCRVVPEPLHELDKVPTLSSEAQLARQHHRIRVHIWVELRRAL